MKENKWQIMVGTPQQRCQLQRALKGVPKIQQFSPVVGRKSMKLYIYFKSLRKGNEFMYY